MRGEHGCGRLALGHSLRVQALTRLRFSQVGNAQALQEHGQLIALTIAVPNQTLQTGKQLMGNAMGEQGGKDG